MSELNFEPPAGVSVADWQRQLIAHLRAKYPNGPRQTLYSTCFGDYIVPHDLAVRTRFTKKGQPDKRFKQSAEFLEWLRNVSGQEPGQ